MLLEWLIVQHSVGVIIASSPWKKVFIEAANFQSCSGMESTLSFEGSDSQTILFISQQEHLTSLLGEYITLCRTSGSPTEIVVRNQMTSPFYVNASEGLTCFTNMDKDLGPLSTTYSSEVGTSFPDRNKDKLTDGFYFGGCTSEGMYLYRSYISNPWVLFDLGGEHRIKRVIIHGHPFASSPDRHPRGVEVRIGNGLITDGDFTSFRLFGYYPDILTPDKNIDFRSENGKKGRFVSIQQKSHHKFYLMNVQIKTF